MPRLAWPKKATNFQGRRRCSALPFCRLLYAHLSKRLAAGASFRVFFAQSTGEGVKMQCEEKSQNVKAPQLGLGSSVSSRSPLISFGWYAFVEQRRPCRRLCFLPWSVCTERRKPGDATKALAKKTPKFSGKGKSVRCKLRFLLTASRTRSVRQTRRQTPSLSLPSQPLECLF